MKGDSPRCNGASTNNGNPGYGGSQFQGGTGGRGAEEGDNNYSGGGGGGFETNGRSNQNFGGAKGTGGEGGKSFYKGNYFFILHEIFTTKSLISRFGKVKFRYQEFYRF